MTTPPVAPSPAAGCPAIGNGTWQAWIDAMPGPGAARMLNISGEVEMPTPGFTLRLVAGPADRAMPPSQRFRLEATAPADMRSQVVTPTTVRYREGATYPGYRSLVILCGDRSLATITEIPIVQ